VLPTAASEDLQKQGLPIQQSSNGIESCLEILNLKEKSGRCEN
jgi:hypothetical protein